MGFFDSIDFGSLLDIASTAAKAYSQYESGKESERQAREAARVADENARLDRQREADAKERASREADAEDQRKRAMIGKQRASMGASGVAVDKGTFADVLSDTEEASQEDQATIMLNGMREAYGYKQRANNLTRQASSYRKAGKSYATAGLVSGVGSLIGGTYEIGNKRGWWQ